MAVHRMLCQHIASRPRANRKAYDLLCLEKVPEGRQSLNNNISHLQHGSNPALTHSFLEISI
jgi:hypothetical protein